MAVTKVANIPPSGQWVLSELDPVIHATCTRVVDPANNANKYRWFFTVTSLSDPKLLPVYFTQTGRWTGGHSESNFYNTLRNSGAIKFGGIISRTSWHRLGCDGAKVHERIVDQKLSGYTKSTATLAPLGHGKTAQTLTALLDRVGHKYTPGAGVPVTPAPQSGTPVTPTPHPSVDGTVQSAHDAIQALQRITIIDTTRARIEACRHALTEKQIDQFDGLSIASESRQTIAQLKNELAFLEVATNTLYATALEQEF